MKKLIILLSVYTLLIISGCAHANFPADTGSATSKIIPGAWRIGKYLPLLKNKRVAVFANNTSIVGSTHLVDTLLALHCDIRKIFAPEHGFRGTADAGEKVTSSTDSKTGITVVSLYGKKRKPSREDLQDIDVVLFDIQDVGARFYTYISSLQDLMEGMMQWNKPLILLDRPNPNGFYVDGPILQRGYRTFLGMQPIPVVYGMTIGEYGKMLLGERWLDSSVKAGNGFALTVIPCDNYTHKSKYLLTEKPSPNLPDMASIYCYPSTCFFEGTILNEGRGTDRPFQIFGHPLLPDTMYTFTPTSRPGAKTPKLLNQVCHGWDLGGTNEEVLKKMSGRIQLKWLIEAYKLYPVKDSFFINNERTFNTLAGSNQLAAQIRNGDSEDQIRESWKPGLDKFKAIRKKYLLYPDYE